MLEIKLNTNWFVLYAFFVKCQDDKAEGFNAIRGMDYMTAILVDKAKEFTHIVCIKMVVNSQRRKILLFLSTNMAAMTSHAILSKCSLGRDDFRVFFVSLN